jgi:hypothetical protein
MARRKNRQLASSPHKFRFAPPAAPTGITSRLLRRVGAAFYLGVSPQTIDSYRLQGFIKPVPMPDVRGAGPLRCPLYDVRDLDAFIEQVKANGGVQ